jgi:hypothetical protein
MIEEVYKSWKVETSASAPPFQGIPLMEEREEMDRPDVR